MDHKDALFEILSSEGALALFLVPPVIIGLFVSFAVHFNAALG
jgi:hypothetical protein